MPENAGNTNSTRVSADRTSPANFATVVTAAYFLLCLPLLALHHGNPAIFVQAGARWSDASQTGPQLPVYANATGYDGQFYYRLAQHPFSFEPKVGGITFDNGAKRMARIMYPLFSWALSFGQGSLTAWALFASNLLGIWAIAWLANTVTESLGLPQVVHLAIMLWPGFLIALTHDTTEITSTALLLAALLTFLSNRVWSYAALASCAVLARETTLPLFFGLLIISCITTDRTSGRWPGWPILAGIAPIIPFLIWHQIVITHVHDLSHANRFAKDIGWPFLGAAKTLVSAVTGLRHWTRMSVGQRVARGIILVTAPAIIAFCCLVATHIKAALCRRPLAGPAVGWLLTTALMSLLTARGPWIDPVSYFRAFTECYVLGCIILGATMPSIKVKNVSLAGCIGMVMIWIICKAQLDLLRSESTL